MKQLSRRKGKFLVLTDYVSVLQKTKHEVEQ